MKILVLNSHNNINLRIIEQHLSIDNNTNVISWNSQIKSAFDAFDEAKPDVVLFDASMKDFLKKVVNVFPSVRFICEDNTSDDTNEYDLTFTTIINKKFEHKKYLPIYFDIISYIKKNQKSIYNADICLNYNLMNALNQKDYLELFVPLTDIRSMYNVKIYGPGCNGLYGCGILNELDQFAAFEQAKICVSLKNYVNSKWDYEIPHHFYNMLKVNNKVVHNIPEAKDSSTLFADNVSDLKNVIQTNISNQSIQKASVPSSFLSCSLLMGLLGFIDEQQTYLSLNTKYMELYS